MGHCLDRKIWVCFASTLLGFVSPSYANGNQDDITRFRPGKRLKLTWRTFCRMIHGGSSESPARIACLGSWHCQKKVSLNLATNKCGIPHHYPGAGDAFRWLGAVECWDCFHSWTSFKKKIEITSAWKNPTGLFHNQWIGVVKNTGPSHVMLF